MSKLPLVPALALAAATSLWAIPHAAPAATSTFYGITVHVSSENIKVQDPRTKQVISFLIVPKFANVFSADGKTTYQMSKIKAGQYVGIIYDRSALGAAHADKIYLLNDANEKIGTQ
jgi:hypothetical protein